MKPRKNYQFTIIAALLSVLWLAPVLPAAEFSADMETLVAGKTVSQGRIFIKGDLSRHEMNQEGRRMIIINRPDRGLAWTMMPQEKSYLEIAMENRDDEMMPENWSADLRLSANRRGTETINGIACDKYELVTEDEKVIYWIDPQNDLPVRVVSQDSEVNYRNVRPGPQSADLFEIPTGWRKISLPRLPGLTGSPQMPGMGDPR
ncbi:MAG TPA: DUF4412 domain-containing protein [Proteobacteria bacterium]|nr:DUF4412 domain-containing protein [Pseudomonadota bacterium]